MIERTIVEGNKRKIKEERTGYASLDNPHLANYPESAKEDVLQDINLRMYDFMIERNKNSLENTAIEYFGTKITYNEMIDKISNYAQILKKFGIQKGDYVSICLPNIPEIVYLKYALNRIGAIANLIDPRTNANGILERTNSTKSKILFCIFDIYENKIKKIESKLKVEEVVSICPSNSLQKDFINQSIKTLPINILYKFKESLVQIQDIIEKGYSYQNMPDFIKKYANNYQNFDVEFEENMPVTALYTSGTTADQMTAGLFSNENYNAMVKNMKYGSKYIEPGKKFLGAIPFFSAYGSFCGFHHSFCNSWTVDMIPTFKPRKYANLIIKSGANAALGVPKFWEQFLAMNHVKSLEKIEIPVTGGDWISTKSIDSINTMFRDNGCNVKLKIGYGATEFGGVVSTTSDDEEKYNKDSVGILLPGNEAMIIDPITQEELTYNEEGELCITGPTMMLGYLNNPEKTAAITIYKDGKKYYRTGDKMKINEYGDLIFCDRYKRVMMRPDGHTVACTPIENTIISHPLVENCAVVGIKMAKESSGSIPTAFIVTKNVDSEDFAKELDQYSLQHLGERERALVIKFIDRIPYTMNGKIDFRSLESDTFETLTDYYIIDDIFFDKKQNNAKKMLQKK